MINWSDDPCSKRAESLSAWWKPVDEGSNPSAPTSIDSSIVPILHRYRAVRARGNADTATEALLLVILQASVHNTPRFEVACVYAESAFVTPIVVLGSNHLGRDHIFAEPVSLQRGECMAAARAAAADVLRFLPVDVAPSCMDEPRLMRSPYSVEGLLK